MGDHFDEDILDDGKRVLNRVTFQSHKSGITSRIAQKAR
jgi:hypothetical protein